MHAFAVLPSLIIAIATASLGLFNDSCSMCWIAIPGNQPYFDEQDRHQKNEENLIILCIFYFLNALVLVVLLADFLVITVSMCLIIQTLHEREMKMSRYNFHRQPLPGRRRMSNNLSKAYNETVKQALIYIAGFIITYTSFIVHMFLMNFLQMHPSLVLSFIENLTLPLQGFWNFVAYMRPRYLIVKAEHQDKNFFIILFKTIMKEPDMVPPRKQSRLSYSLSHTNTRRQRSGRSEEMFVSNSRRKPDGNHEQEEGILLHKNNIDSDSAYHSNDGEILGNLSPTTTPKSKSSATASHANNFFTRTDEEETFASPSKSGTKSLEKIDETDIMPEVLPTLSLLVAQDSFPLQNYQFRRRRSMIDISRFPLRDLESGDSVSTAFNNNSHIEVNDCEIREGHRKKDRRHSCPHL